MDLSQKEELSIQFSLLDKIRSYASFFKLRLASLVVFSAALGYLIAADTINWFDFLMLSLGGFLVTGSSNGYNQIIEVNLDRLMDRTKNRPLVTGKMSRQEAYILATLSGIIGISILWYFLNPLSGILGIFALFIYVLIYTPLKQISPWAVFVGAFPGAIPPMLGVIAYTGTFSDQAGMIAGMLFFIQFIWQFPHFWAIAWVLDEDYAKGGFSLLPSKTRKSKRSAFHILIYTLFMVPVSLIPWVLDLTGDITLVIGAIAGAWFFIYAYKLYLNLDDKSAKSLMFASFIYLPIIQFLYVFNKF